MTGEERRKEIEKEKSARQSAQAKELEKAATETEAAAIAAATAAAEAEASEQHQEDAFAKMPNDGSVAEQTAKEQQTVTKEKPASSQPLSASADDSVDKELGAAEPLAEGAPQQQRVGRALDARQRRRASGGEARDGFEERVDGCEHAGQHVRQRAEE